MPDSLIKTAPVARPILMSGEMVRATLEGRKTQTRRVVTSGRYRLDGYSPTGRLVDYHGNGNTLGLEYTHDERGLWDGDSNPDGRSALILPCPYGLPGDLMYVREAWHAHKLDDNLSPAELSPSSPSRIWWHADDSRDNADYIGKLRPSIHMPRWASRLTLVVEDIRVERLQEISEEDAVAEGAIAYAERGEAPDPIGAAEPVYAFRELWDSLNASRGYGWDANPWVWVVQFRPIAKNVDAVLREMGHA